MITFDEYKNLKKGDIVFSEDHKAHIFLDLHGNKWVLVKDSNGELLQIDLSMFIDEYSINPF